MSAATLGAVGILGGTFDPIHYGHLRLAQEVADALALACVRFVPGGTPPHRAAPQTSAADRVAMVKLAIADQPLFALDDRETRRVGKSYTVDTLTEVRAELGATCPLVLIVGADAFSGFESWHRWQDIFSLAHVAVVQRPGSSGSGMSAALAREFTQRRSDDLQVVHRAPAGAIVEVPITALDISATAIRGLIQAKRSARYLLPATVLAYIEHKIEHNTEYNYLFLKDKLQ